MKIDPMAPQKMKGWALLAPGWRTLDVTTDDEVTRHAGSRACYDALEELGKSGRMLYVAGNLTHLRHTTGARAWEAEVWRGRATAMHLAGTRAKVSSLRGTLDGTDAAAELARALAWLGARGVAPAGISSMAWALWARSLDAPLAISAAPKVGRAAFYGGRQEVKGKGPGTYRHMVCADITAAYPTAMAARPYGLRLSAVDPSTTLDPNVAGLAEAVVGVPGDMPYPPLPYRLGPEHIQFATGRLHGTWPWCELAAAAELGCDVSVRRSWAPFAEGDPFGAWWRWVAEGRALGGGAGRLVKAIANSTWGIFAMAGDDRSTVRWLDDTGAESVTVALKALTRLPHRNMAHVAAETAARVRTRILTEALYGANAGPVHIDTDGIIMRRSAPLPSPGGDEPGQWRIKKAMREVELRAPQCYRDKCESPCAGCRMGEWHYVTAGMGPDAARGVFERIGKGTPFGVMGLDFVLPTRNTLELDLSRADALEALAISVSAFGPGLGALP